MTAANPASERSFEHFRAPKSPGLGGLGSIGTTLLIIAAGIGIGITILVNLIAGLVWGAFAGLALMSMAVRDQHGVSVLEKAGARAAHRRAVRTGTAHYHSGPLDPSGQLHTARHPRRHRVDRAGRPDRELVRTGAHPTHRALRGDD